MSTRRPRPCSTSSGKLPSRAVPRASTISISRFGPGDRRRSILSAPRGEATAVALSGISHGHAPPIMLEPCVTRSIHHNHAYGIVALEDVDGDVVFVPAQQHVYTGVAELEPPNPQLVDIARQHRLLEPDLAVGVVAFEAETGL